MRFGSILIAITSGWLVCSCSTPAPERPLVLVHVMPWFESKAVSGHWGWHWTMGKLDPEQGVLASHDRPLLGPYDSSDPTVINAQVALIKAAGIDGAIIDWNGVEGFADYAMIHRNTQLLIAELKKAGLKFALCIEDNPGQRFIQEQKLSRAQAVARVATSFAWADRHWFSDAAYIRISGRPVLLIFGPQFLSGPEWSAIRSTLKNNPLTFALPHLRQQPDIDGAFAWIPVSEGKTVGEATWTAELAELYSNSTKERRPTVAVAFPGYRDFYAQAGAGKTYGFIDYRDGATFAQSFEQAMKSGAPIVQIATWNDYGEGTGIEPTVARGFRDLEVIMRHLRPDADPAELKKILEAFKR
ncbi:MAG: hypothetical protein EBS64_07010 [Verrucomicrobia bacterium]|nr:hypothetical protein [Verrucomicrobiota bacterium]